MKRVIPCVLMLCLRAIVLFQEQFVNLGFQRHVLAAALSLSVIVRAMPSGVVAADEPLRLDSGLVSGVRGADPVVRVFKGIPFAAPPVGVLRWRSPQPVRSWVGIRKADQFSPICPQPPRVGVAALLGTSQRLGSSNEDCLYLNVWTTATSSGEKRPVMVWFPGGGFTTGGGSALVFDGEALAAKGVVVVTTNYRLGVLGFFAHPALTSESNHHASGNYGLLDQIAILRWVQTNIAVFGGNPENVTILGQSAGATSVSYLMASPLAKGLFHRGIGESGGGTGGVFALDPTLRLLQAERVGAQVQQTLAAKSVADLRAIPADDLVRKIEGTSNDGAVIGTGPIVDGWVIPTDVGVVFARGQQARVPLIAGSTADDGGSARAKAPDAYVDASRKQFGEQFEAYIKLYPDGSDERMRTLNADTQAWRVEHWTRIQSLAGIRNTYLYYFTRRAPIDAPAPNRAYHGAEAFYVFHNLRLFAQRWTDIDRTLEDIVSTYWVNFAKRGDPNGPNLPRWPAYTSARRDRVMMLGDTIEDTQSRLDRSKIEFFDAYYARLRSE